MSTCDYQLDKTMGKKNKEKWNNIGGSLGGSLIWGGYKVDGVWHSGLRVFGKEFWCRP